MAIEAQNCGLEEAYVESEGFTFDSCLASTDLKHLSSTSFEVKELEELPEQWRRSKVAWLCKELPSHKPATLIRILNAQKKWITQEDCTYISVHCMRVRENEAGFRVRYLNDIPIFPLFLGTAVHYLIYIDIPVIILKSNIIFNIWRDISGEIDIDISRFLIFYI